MRLVELALARARRAPGLDELARAVELHDARVRHLAVTVGDEDVPVRRDDDSARRIECVVRGARNPRLAERHQDAAVGADLPDRMALAGAAIARGCAAIVGD